MQKYFILLYIPIFDVTANPPETVKTSLFTGALVCTIENIEKVFDKFQERATDIRYKTGVSYIRPSYAFSVSPGRILNKLKSSETFCLALSGSGKAGSPSFHHCLPCQVGSIRRVIYSLKVLLKFPHWGQKKFSTCWSPLLT